MLDYYKLKNEVGLDEAGRGSLCGPVVAGAVIWNEKYNNIPGVELIKDSKKLSKKNRKKAYEWIKNNIDIYAYGIVDNNEIDNTNILKATIKSMNIAIKKIEEKTDIKLLIIDGINWKKEDFNYNIESIVKGDSKYKSIACASIIAKEVHDELILKENKELLIKYDLINNKGYGTKKHREALIKYGYSDYHRKSFKIK